MLPSLINSTFWHSGCALNSRNTGRPQWKGVFLICLLCFDMLVMACVQGFNSDSEDDNSDDEGDDVEGMSGDEQMGEQEDFEGSDGFDEASCASSNIAAGTANTQYCAHVQQHYCKAMVSMHEAGCIGCVCV